MVLDETDPGWILDGETLILTDKLPLHSFNNGLKTQKIGSHFVFIDTVGELKTAAAAV